MVLHPGTAIRWEDELWEVVGAGSGPAESSWYDLAPWDEQHAIRLLLPYDETSEAERVAERRDASRRRAAGRVTLLLAPVAGLLPGRIQEKLGVELGIRATALTLASVFVPMAVGTYCLLMLLAAGFGAGMRLGGPSVEVFFPLLTYFLPESLLRLSIGMAQGRPIGSILGLPLYALGRLTGVLERPEREQVTLAPTDDRLLSDRFLMLEPLLSFLPAPDQATLRGRMGFSPVTWGKRTAWFLLVYPGLTAPAQALGLLTHGGGLGSILALVATVALAAEQVWRLQLLERGEPAPSVLGHLVKPYAAPLLR